MGVRSAPARPLTSACSCDRTPRASSITPLLRAGLGLRSGFGVYQELRLGLGGACTRTYIQNCGYTAGPDTPPLTAACCMGWTAGASAQHADLQTHWMPSFSLMMPPSLASSTASSSAAAFFFRNFFSPLLSLLSVSAAAPASASVVFSNLLNALSFTICAAAHRKR